MSENHENNKSPVFRTERANLWPMSQRFQTELIELHSCEKVMKHLGGVYTGEQTTLKIQESESHWLAHGFGLWCWQDKQTKQFIGRGGLRYQTLDCGKKITELAYMMHANFWGRGVTTEIMTYALQLAFSVFNMDVVYALTVKDNKKSQQVMKRLGMEFDIETVLFRGKPHLMAVTNGINTRE